MPRRLSLHILALGAVFAAAGCSRSELPVPRARDAGLAAVGAGGAPVEPVDAGADADADADAGVDASDAGFPPIAEIVYVSTNTLLYQLDVDALVLGFIGSFAGCEGTVIDIAVDRENRMFATTTKGFASVSPATGACSMIAFGAYPNSLATVPEGTVDPADEALVGFVGSTYVRIDKLTGALSVVGDLGGGALISSGDIAVLPNGRAFLSVKQGGCADCIVEIDPATGAMLALLGPIGYANVYGLASSKGMGLGFDAEGAVLTVDLSTGAGTYVAVAAAPPGAHFSGAASLPAKVGP